MLWKYRKALPVIIPLMLDAGLQMAGVEIQWLGYSLITIAILGAIYFVYSLIKEKQLSEEQPGQAKLIAEHPQGTSNILHIERQEPPNRPPLLLLLIGMLASLLLLTFAGFQTYLVLSGVIVAKFNLEWFAFYLLFGLLPLWLLLEPFTFDRKYYKSGRSATAIDVTFVVSGDITDIFNRCFNILETMKAKIIRKNTPNLIKVRLNKSNISIEVSPSDDNVKVYVVSDATWVTVKVGKGRNRRIIDKFQKHFIDEFRVSKPDNIDDIQPIVQRDNVLWAEQSLVLTPHTYAIGLSGMTGYPDEPDNADWLCLEVAVNHISKPIDTLDLRINSETIPANHWPGKNVAAFNVYFNVTLWRWKGRKQVELIAYVGNKMYRSGRMNIDFNVEAWGSHRI